MYSSSSSSSTSSSNSSSTSSKSKSSLSTSSFSNSYSSSSSSEKSSSSRSSLSHSSLSSSSKSSSTLSSSSTEILSSFSSSSSSSTEIKSSSSSLSSSSSSTEIKSSSSTSSESSFPIDLEHEVIVAMACRDYGEGRILIHTDRIGAYFTGHGNNSNELWRKILEWTSKKNSNELIRVGLINSTEQDSLNKIKEISFVNVEDIKLSDFSYINLSDYDCLYFVGLPESISSSITLEIKEFVENGKGLLIEYPNISQNINVLSDIENIGCYSSERLILTNAYWTIDGGNHYIYNDPVEISFMSTLRQVDFSEEWTILMSNVPNVVTTTTTTGNGSIFDFNLSSGSEFVISFISSMQNGIVEIEEDVSTSSSSESSFIGTSESTLSSDSSDSSTDSSSTSSEYFDLVWTKYDNTIPSASDTTSTNGRLARGVSGGDSDGVISPCVIKDGNTYKMWYSSPSLTTIYYATSSDGLIWAKYNNAVETSSDQVGHDGRIPKGSSGADSSQIGYPCVIKDGSIYKMWYSGSNGTNWRIFHAYSYDGLTWTKYDNSLLAPSNTMGTNGRIPLGVSGLGDSHQVFYPCVIKDGSIYKMWYSGEYNSRRRIYYAYSYDGLTWNKLDNSFTSPSDSICTNGRIMLGNSGTGDDFGALSPCVIKTDNTYKMWYTGYPNASTNYCIYYATSPDGLTWTKYDNTAPSLSDSISTNGRIPNGTATTGIGDRTNSYNCYVILDNGIYKSWYSGYYNSYDIYYAEG